MKWSSFFIGFITAVILIASLIIIFSPNRYDFSQQQRVVFRYDTWTGRGWVTDLAGQVGDGEWIEVGEGNTDFN